MMKNEKFFTTWMAAGLVISIAWLGFLAWVIYELVTWLTSK